MAALVRLSRRYVGQCTKLSGNMTGLNGISVPSSTPQKRTIMTGPEVIATAVATLQHVTNMPWWATITVATVITKVSLLPFVYGSYVVSKRTQKAVPHIHETQKLFHKEFSIIPPTDYKKRLSMMWDMARGASYALQIQKSSFTKIFAFPVLNMSFFFTFIYTIRRILQESDLSSVLEKGGIFWFTDLTTADATMILPLSAAALTYSALHVSFGDAKGSLATFLRDFTQCAVILGLPFTTQLPAGVFLYWIPSTIFNIGQTLVIRKLNRDAIRPPELKKKSPVEGTAVSSSDSSGSTVSSEHSPTGGDKPAQ